MVNKKIIKELHYSITLFFDIIVFLLKLVVKIMGIYEIFYQNMFSEKKNRRLYCLVSKKFCM